MNIIELFNKNIIYFYIDIYNLENNKKIKKNILFTISTIIENNELYFMNIIKNKLYYQYKDEILNKNNIILDNNILKYIENILEIKLNIFKIYKDLLYKQKEIISNYIKIFILLCEKYYFTL